MKKIIQYFLISIILFLNCAAAFAQTIVQESLSTQPKISVNLAKEKQDSVGTDVSNVYSITVNNGGAAPQGPYAVVYLLDGKPVEVFRNQPLPFTLKRNFKGQAPGRHQLQILVEGQNDVILGSQTMNIDVVKGEQKIKAEQK